MRHNQSRAWLLFVCLFAAACHAGGSDVILGSVERLNTERGAVGRFTFPYYVALGVIDGGGALAVWMRREDRFRPLVYRRAPDRSSPFGGEEYLSPETLRQTISIVPTLADGPRKGELYAIWQARLPTSGHKFIVFRRSEDAGVSWGDAETVNSASGSFIPAMAVGRNGSIYAAWPDERERSTEVFFNRSLDYGATWLPADVKISGKPSQWSAAISVQIATDGTDTVLVVWEEQGPRGRTIRATTSTDRGETWSEPIRVDDDGGRGAPSSPSLVFASDRAFVVWTAASTGVQAIGQVWADVSKDGGLSWDEDVLLNEVEGGISPRAHLVSTGDNAMVVFHAGPAQGSWAIFYSVTGPTGDWVGRGTEVARVSSGEGKFSNPRIAVDPKGVLFVIYEDGGKRILLNHSIDGGKTWSSANQLVYALQGQKGTAEARYPQVAAADGVAYVSWEVWGDTTGMFKSFADAESKTRPSDLYVRRVTLRR